MGSSPTPPPVADPNVVASNQQALNTTAGQESQAGSMVNQSNPYGTLNYSQTGTSSNGTPLYTASETLTPAQQGLLNTLQGTQQTAGTQAGNVLSGANYGAQTPSAAIGNATSGLTGQAVQQEQQYLQPFFAPQVSQLDTQLQNEGFHPGEPAYQQAMNGLLQSQGQTTTGFLANIEPQMFQQAESTYELPAQLAGSLAQLGAPANVNSNLTTTPGLNVSPANLIGATANAQSAQQATYQDQLQQQNALMSGLFGIPTAVLGGLAKGGGLTGLSSLFSGAGAAGAGADISGSAMATLEGLGSAAII